MAQSPSTTPSYGTTTSLAGYHAHLRRPRWTGADWISTNSHLVGLFGPLGSNANIHKKRCCIAVSANMVACGTWRSSSPTMAKQRPSCRRERSRHPRPRVRQSREPKSGLFGVDVPNHARRRALRELPAGGRATAAPAGLRPIHCHFTWNLHQQGV